MLMLWLLGRSALSANTVPGTTSPYYRSSIDPPKPSLDALLVDVPADVPADVLPSDGCFAGAGSKPTNTWCSIRIDMVPLCGSR